MKILVVAPPWIDTPPNQYGGTELVLYGLVEELAKHGHDVTLFATKKSKTSAKLDYVFEDCLCDLDISWASALPPMLHYIQAFKKAEEEQFDVIHAQLSSSTDVMILPLLSTTKIPFVVTVHGIWPFDTVTNTDKLMLQYYGDKTPFVHISKAMMKIQPPELEPLGFVYNGLIMDDFVFNPRPKGYLTWIGRICKDKGVGLAIQAALKSGEQFIFAGIVDPHVPEMKQYFEEQVEPYIDGKQIQFLGPADLKMKNELLGDAKAFLNPIQWEEPFGMVMIESMATGTPVISFSRGAANELIVDGTTGYLLKNESVDALVDAINKVDKINRQLTRDYVARSFSSRAMMKGYLDMYKRVMKGEKKGNIMNIERNALLRREQRVE